MNIEWRYSDEEVNWDKLSYLYKVAPLGDKKPENLKKVFNNSMYKCFIYNNEDLIAAGRILADGVDCAYICDIAVSPTHQKLGLGKSIVSKLVSLSKGHKKIILYAYPGKEAFYKKLGFKRMSTAMAIFDDQDQALRSGLVNNT